MTHCLCTFGFTFIKYIMYVHYDDTNFVQTMTLFMYIYKDRLNVETKCASTSMYKVHFICTLCMYIFMYIIVYIFHVHFNVKSALY